MIIALWQEMLKTSDWKHWEHFNFHSVDFISALPVKPVSPLRHVWSLSPTTHLCLNFILPIRVQLTEQGIILTKELSKADRTETNVDPFPLYPEQTAGRRARKNISLPDSYLIPTLTISWWGYRVFYDSSWWNFTNSSSGAVIWNYHFLLNLKP